MGRPTCTAIIPAHNEEVGILDTLKSFIRQTEQFDKIIVAADNCTDRTVQVCEDFAERSSAPIIVIECSGGSKAKAQNIALAYATTDLVLPVDADTVLSDNYLALIKEPFIEYDDMAVAAGCVLTKHADSVWECGRQIEYLFGFHFYRPVQNSTHAPTVCSGCNTAFHRQRLVEFGGFPERTIVEDIDYTWSQQIAGFRAVYVGDAVAYAAEPINATYMKKQLWRWKSGYFQNIRQHFFGGGMLTHKPMLALWVSLQLIETLIAPLFIALPMIWIYNGISIWAILLLFLMSEFITLGLPVGYGCIKRGIRFRDALKYYPAWWLLKGLNFYYDWKAMIVELVLVPLRLSDGLHDYEKGRA